MQLCYQVKRRYRNCCSPWISNRPATLVEVKTDNGLVGWGEGGGAPTPTEIEGHVIGRSPFDYEVIYDSLSQGGKRSSQVCGVEMALWDLTQVLARALAPHIRVNGIGPGPAMINARQSDADFDRQCAATILQRGTTPEEICAAIRFILSVPSMTGQMIALDGGQHLAWETPDVAGVPE